jgi:rubredoxin
MAFRPYLWTIRGFLNYLKEPWFYQSVTKNCRSMEQTMKRYLCVVCGFIYDEAKGLPDEGIAPGTRWDDIPENWTCPDCGAVKSDFEMIEV